MASWKSNQAAREERRKHVSANLLAGISYRQMAEALEVSIGTISNDVKIILGRWQREQIQNTAGWVALELQRLDRAAVAIWPDVLDGKLQAIDRLLKIMERRAKLLGLDGPIQIAGKDGKDLLPIADLVRALRAADDALGDDA